MTNDDDQGNRPDATQSVPPDGGRGPTLPGDIDVKNDLPVPDWDRYRYVAYLGGGGMGTVYKAYDPNLRRHVALKFIRGDDPRLVRRFEQEARAQAVVDHERVCKVFEVGSVRGRPYIAMQFIDGDSLDVAARSLTLEQKLIVLREVARGLHAAHRVGLIHRDVKPANIVVERGEPGDLKPYVMDFGLARASDSGGMTMSGSVLGTPAYMAPEQARGDVHNVDRRCDVYGLGATMYHVLIGKPPFEGAHVASVMRQVIEDVPEAPQRVDDSIPADIDAIAMRCLRKDPRDRYPSAQAFAADLQCYLDGDPVKARPTGVLYRARMKARKHRTAVAVGGVAAALLAASVAWGGYTAWMSARRSRVAQEFGQQVEQIEAIARYAHTIPLHDVRPERAMIRARMDVMESRMRDAGWIATGPGQYAVGRGHLALGRYQLARDRLEDAWEAGYQAPQVAYALGRSYGELYIAALLETERIRDDVLRARRVATIEEAYRAPALKYLRAGRDVDTESPALIEAMVAFHEERIDVALERARAARSDRPWLYEAAKLEGDIRTEIAVAAGRKGMHERADESFDEASEAYALAARIGESDPAVHLARCRSDHARVLAEINGRGEDITPYYDAGLDACDATLVADPGLADAYVVRAGLHGRMGEFRRMRGEDPARFLDLALDDALSALEIRPDLARAQGYAGAAYTERATYRIDRGQDPRDDLVQAIRAYRRAIVVDRDHPGWHNNLGIAFQKLATYHGSRGEDPHPAYRDAVEAYEDSLAIEPDQFAAWTNLGSVHYSLARIVEDPEPEMEAAIAAFSRAAKINPDHMVVHYQIGRVRTLLAERRVDRGQDPRGDLDGATSAYRRAIELSATSAHLAHFLNGLGRVQHLTAMHLLESGQDPGPMFGDAVESYRSAIEVNPNLVFAHDNLGATLVAQASHAIDSGRSPGTTLDEAITALRDALAIKPDFDFAWADLGDAHRVAARGAIAEGQDPAAAIAAAQRSYRKALELNPTQPEAQRGLARLERLSGD